MDRQSHSIEAGTTVYTQDGTKIGDVVERTDTYLLVQKGWLFVTDRYIPLASIDHVGADGVYLNLTQSALDTTDWSAPPTPTAGDALSEQADETIYAHPRASAVPAATDTTMQRQPSAAAITAATTTERSMLEQEGEIKIPVVEEELQVGKRDVERGGVRVTTRVTEMPVSEQVTLHQENVDVHRAPVDRAVSDADHAFQDASFEVRGHAEEAVVDKQARVIEEVQITKDVSDRTENIQDTVRRTDVDVQQMTGTRAASGTEEIGRVGSQGVTGRDQTAKPTLGGQLHDRKRGPKRSR